MQIAEHYDNYTGKWVRIFGKNWQFGGKVDEVKDGIVYLRPFVMHAPEKEEPYQLRETTRQEINPGAIEGIVEVTEEEIRAHLNFLNKPKEKK